MLEKKSNLVQLSTLCLGYFAAYVVYGLFLKWLLKEGPGFPGMNGMAALFNTSASSMALCLFVVLIFWWPGRLKGQMPRIWGGRLAGEYAWLIPSGICTGFVIPTTTLMYTYGYSVMVAMVLMRASLIIASRVVDAILIRQKLVDKRVYWQEDAAVVAAVVAVSTVIFGAGKDDFRFFESPTAVITMLLYIVPYGIRIYILNRFKIKADHKAIFGIEQLFAALTAVVVVSVLLVLYSAGWRPIQLVQFSQGLFHPDLTALAIGLPYGVAAFFSVFLFLYKGGTATFNTTMNRLTSLVAGTMATLLFWLIYDGKPVKPNDWFALAVVFVAIGLLAWSGRRRSLEEAAARAKA